jgi:hypothetical protein
MEMFEGVETFSREEVECMLAKLEEIRVISRLPDDAFDDLTLSQIKALVDNDKKGMQ